MPPLNAAGVGLVGGSLVGFRDLDELDSAPERDDLVDLLADYIGPSPPGRSDPGFFDLPREDTISGLFTRLRELTSAPAESTASLPPVAPPPPQPVLPTPATDTRGLLAPGTLTGFAAEVRSPGSSGFARRRPLTREERLPPPPPPPAPTRPPLSLRPPPRPPSPVSAPPISPSDTAPSPSPGDIALHDIGATPGTNGFQLVVLPPISEGGDENSGSSSAAFGVPSGFTVGDSVTQGDLATLYPTIYGDEGDIVTPEEQYVRHLEALYGR